MLQHHQLLRHPMSGMSSQQRPSKCAGEKWKGAHIRLKIGKPIQNKACRRAYKNSMVEIHIIITPCLKVNCSLSNENSDLGHAFQARGSILEC